MVNISGIDNILKKRFHGAVNIRGIRFQLQYSLFRLLQIHINKEKTCVQFEGIEDVDIKPLKLSNNLYIQVKTSDNPWNWAKLKDPIKGFLEVLKTDENAQFQLVVNFRLEKKIHKISKYNQLEKHEQATIKNDFIELCKNASISETEAKALFDRFKIQSIPDDNLTSELSILISQLFNVKTGNLEWYSSSLLGKCLHWAEERKSVSSKDVECFKSSLIMGIERQKDFEAYGQHLIDHINWNTDKTNKDFYDGKGARPGHISANLDVRRVEWLEKIDRAFNRAQICVIKSSSGQGKSTLLYRYIFENWLQEDTFVIKCCKTKVDAERIIDFIRFRNTHGLFSCLVIEDAGLEVSQWTSVAQECSALEVPLIIGVRNEDWFRYSKSSICNIEIIEPTLSLQEAKDIYKNLKKQNKVKSSSLSAEYAFEKIGTPHLLIEFIYFITHGIMLYERLKEQILCIQNNENSESIELIRKIVSAHTVGVPLNARNLALTIQSSKDPQFIFESLDQEFISIQKSLVSGLHWVRSKHLFDILHNDYIAKEQTLADIVEFVPDEYRPFSIGNSIALLTDSNKDYIKILAKKTDIKDLSTVVNYIEGIFWGGERIFVLQNKSLFDEMGTYGGYSSIKLWSSQLLPTTPIDMLERFPYINNENEIKARIKKILEKLQSQERGKHLVKMFLENIFNNLEEICVNHNEKQIGQLLDWSALCDYPININISPPDDFLNNNFDLIASFMIGWYKPEIRRV